MTNKLDSTGLFILDNQNKDIVPYTFSYSKMILCGVPGAFTSGCTYRHLPGFADHLEELKEKGIEKVAFMSVNDAFVMEAWNQNHGADDIDAVSDPLAVFSKRIKEFSKNNR